MSQTNIQNNQSQNESQQTQFLTFMLDKEVYGIQIDHVREIVGLQPITKLPRTPDYMKGIINLRGQIIPVMDFRIRLKKPTINYTDRTCIIIIDTDNLHAGLIVDQVSEVLNIDANNIVLPPDLNCYEKQYIQGIGKEGDQVRLLLDCNVLFSSEQFEELTEDNGGKGHEKK